VYRKPHTRRKRKMSWRQFHSNSNNKSLWIDRKTEVHTRFMALFFFVGVGLILVVGSKTLVSWIAISRIAALIAVVSSFIPIKFFPIIYRVRKELKVIFTICALTPMLTSLLLLTNYIFISDVNIESYKVVSIESHPNDDIFKVNLENDTYKEFRQIRSFSYYDYSHEPDSAHYKTGKGVFSFKVVRKAYLTPNQ